MRRAFALIFLLAACREAPEPFTMVEPFEDYTGQQLTFNVHDDHAPVWNASSDTIYYSTRSFPGLLSGKGVLLAVPRTGGTARMVLPTVQSGNPRQPRLASLAVSRDGANAAFFELTVVRDQQFARIVCTQFPDGPTPWDTLGTSSILREAVLRVRPTSPSAISDAATLTVSFAGRVGDDTGDDIINIAYPFQRMFEIDDVPFFRPSWSPDGKRIAFSDGSNVRIWTVGEASSSILPGSDEGILPAWSPDGNWIAFSKPYRERTIQITCLGFLDQIFHARGVFFRTIYTPYRRDDAELFIVRVDGTGLRSLGVGEAPAWTPDSQSIVARRDGSLFRIAIDGAAAAVLPNTHDAFEPVISPDGKFIAFARHSAAVGNHDIWVSSF